MMNMMLTKLHRQLHTIISQETIKPSSPTPSHLKTHNLSVIDNYLPPIHMPWIFFYKSYNNGDIDILKKSLSQCLTQYYPFAGRLPTTSSPDHVNCNDEGVEFLEASIDSRLDDFVVKKLEQEETLDQLIPHSLGCPVNKTSTSIVEVQLNHFTCGGAALAVSIAHKVADGFTMLNFINHWATVTRGETPPVKLSFSSSSSSSSISNHKSPEQVEVTGKVKYVIRRFLFSNSKLNELKNKVNAMGTTPVNPTRVDSLTALLFKCAVRAATTKSGSSQQSNLVQMVNLRGNIGSSKFPKLGAGNIIAMVNATIADSGKIKLNDIITSLRKERMELQGVRDMEEIGKRWANTGDGRCRTYACSSLCRFPLYQVDFGWGNPVRAMLRHGNQDLNIFILMDTPSGDGIEATVNLEEEEMAIFQQDKELLAYTQDDQYMI